MVSLLIDLVILHREQPTVTNGIVQNRRAQVSIRPYMQFLCCRQHCWQHPQALRNLCSICMMCRTKWCDSAKYTI